MPTPIVMPKLGMSMEEGTVVSWPAAVGGHIEKGTVVLVIESEKAEIEIDATASGFFRHVYVDEDETVPCGTLLAALTETADEDFDVAAFSDANQPEVMVSRVGAADAASPSPAPVAAKRSQDRVPTKGAPTTPAARKIAKQEGVDLGQVPGTGPGGRITREDVLAFAERRKALVEVAEGVALEVPVLGPEDAERTVLLLPGFGTDVSAFARQTPWLAEERRVLGLNPRGVGLSDAPESEIYTVAEMASDAARVAAQASGPVDVIGMSLGASVAIELAIAHPECVRSLTLITPLLTAGERLQAVIRSWCAVAAAGSPETIAQALLPWLFSPELLADARASERTLRGLAAIAARVPAATLTRSAAGLSAWSGTRESDVGNLDVPTCVIAAGGDLLTPDGEAVAAAIPGASCVIVPNAGHAVALEAPEAVDEAIAAHLSS